MRFSFPKFAVVALVAMSIIGCVYYFKNNKPEPAHDEIEHTQLQDQQEPEQHEAVSQYALSESILSEHGKEGAPAELDLKMMSDFIKSATKENAHIDTFHFSSNPALTEILLGKKGISYSLIKTSHPSIGKDEYGESVLLDRWSTPYRIHLIHRNEIEVFSAGPDKIMGNADDLRWPLLSGE